MENYRGGLLLINQNIKTRLIKGDVAFYRKYEIIGWEIRQTGNLKHVFFIPLEAIKYDLDIGIAEKGLYDFVTVFNQYVLGEGSVRKTRLEEYSKIRLLFDDETIDNLFEFIKEYVKEDEDDEENTTLKKNKDKEQDVLFLSKIRENQSQMIMKLNDDNKQLRDLLKDDEKEIKTLKKSNQKLLESLVEKESED